MTDFLNTDSTFLTKQVAAVRSATAEYQDDTHQNNKLREFTGKKSGPDLFWSAVFFCIMFSLASIVDNVRIITSILGGLGGLGTLVLAILYYFQYGSLKDQREQQKKQTKIQQQQAELMELQFRPNLLVREIDPESKGEGHELLKLHLINAGKDVAKDLHLRCDARVGVGGETVDLVQSGIIKGNDRPYAFSPAMGKLRRQPRGDIAREPLAEGGLLEAGESAWFSGEIHFQMADEINFKEGEEERWQGQPFSNTIDHLRDLGVRIIHLQFSLIYRDVMDNVHVKTFLAGSADLTGEFNFDDESQPRSLDGLVTGIAFRSGSFGGFLSEEEIKQRVLNNEPFPLVD